MGKLLLLSPVLFSIYVPILLAKACRPRRGLTLFVGAVALFHAFYMFAWLKLWPSLSEVTAATQGAGQQ